MSSAVELHLSDAVLRLSDEDVERIAVAVSRYLPNVMPDWLLKQPATPAEVADWLRVSEKTLLRWRKNGTLPAFEEGNVVRYTPLHLAAGLAAGILKGHHECQ